MPTIRVTVDTVDYCSVLEYYNTHKKEDEPALEKLGRAEGGFQVKIPGKENERCDSNQKIRQSRWTRKCLVTPGGCKSLQECELELLFHALCHIYGEEQISLEAEMKK